MLVILTGKASKGDKNKSKRQNDKKHKYKPMERCHHDHWFQVYMYDLMYLDLATISEEDYLPGTKTFAENCMKNYLQDH